MIDRVSPDRALRICAFGNLDGIHTHSWLRYFVDRGHDVHGVSYYAPSRPPQGVTVHGLRPRPAASGSFQGRTRSGLTRSLRRALPPSVERLANLVRFRRAGLRRVVEEIAPDVLHGHFLVEHGFFGTSAAFHPYVVSAWGSDVLVEPRSPANRQIARFTTSRADLVTANNRYMAREIVLKLGKERAWVQHIVLGVSLSFLDGAPQSVNALSSGGTPPTVISTRSLDTPLYNIDIILRAFAEARGRVSNARLIIAGDGRLRLGLESLAKQLRLEDAVSFTGNLDEPAFRDALSRAHVFVSTPTSDATSVALLQAMGVGAFPIVSDLPSQQELVENEVQGLRVPVRDEPALASAIVRALEDAELRRSAVERNRAFVEDYGITEKNMAKMEAWYYRLAGRTEQWTPPASI